MRRLRALPLPGAIVRRGAWGLPDQAFISLSNFTTTVLLARALSAERFGEFAVAFSFITVIMALGTAALSQPFVVLSARHEGSKYRRYLASTMSAQIIFVIMVSIPIAIASMLAFGIGWRLAGLVAIIIPAIGAWQIQDFIRQVFYTENRLRSAFINDIISYGGQTLGFVIAFAAGFLTPVSGLAILAVTSLIAIAEGLWLLRHSFDWSFSREEFRVFMTETWDFGRWTFGHAILAAATGFIMMLMLATLSGAAASGVLRAFVTITAPMRVLIMGAKTSFGPSAAQVAEREGVVGLRPYIRNVFLLVGPVIAAYCLFVVVFSHSILDLLYAGTFNEYAGLLPILIIAYFITEIFFPLEIGLRARRVTNIIFTASLVGAIGTWVLGPPLVHFFGLEGLLWLALCLAPVSGVMLWLRYQREMQGPVPESEASTARAAEGVG